jgi:hypothetical protein
MFESKGFRGLTPPEIVVVVIIPTNIDASYVDCTPDFEYLPPAGST